MMHASIARSKVTRELLRSPHATVLSLSFLLETRSETDAKSCKTSRSGLQKRLRPTEGPFGFQRLIVGRKMLPNRYHGSSGDGDRGTSTAQPPAPNDRYFALTNVT